MAQHESDQISSVDRCVCLYEINNGLVYGTVEQLREIEQNELVGCCVMCFYH
ncbi:unnamed protein product [Gongylonema pulchrum]|uniref:CheW-like domain-containing protein n=1 Tax=Gongylonema pulchrum TaxID=637853 RepID=A0A183DG01_9BILA|nr:unnamed protein product [Gongylonema pulchrum]